MNWKICFILQKRTASSRNNRLCRRRKLGVSNDFHSFSIDAMVFSNCSASIIPPPRLFFPLSVFRSSLQLTLCLFIVQTKWSNYSPSMGACLLGYTEFLDNFKIKDSRWIWGKIQLWESPFLGNPEKALTFRHDLKLKWYIYSCRASGTIETTINIVFVYLYTCCTLKYYILIVVGHHARTLCQPKLIELATLNKLYLNITEYKVILKNIITRVSPRTHTVSEVFYYGHVGGHFEEKKLHIFFFGHKGIVYKICCRKSNV